MLFQFALLLLKHLIQLCEYFIGLLPGHSTEGVAQVSLQVIDYFGENGFTVEEYRIWVVGEHETHLVHIQFVGFVSVLHFPNVADLFVYDLVDFVLEERLGPGGLLPVFLQFFVHPGWFGLDFFEIVLEHHFIH